MPTSAFVSVSGLLRSSLGLLILRLFLRRTRTLTIGDFSLWYHEDSAGQEERSVPENLEHPGGDTVETRSHSQTLIERSSFTSMTDQAARPEDRLRSTCKNHAVEFLQHQSIPSNHDDKR